MKILIAGYYGFKNTGDELILKSLVRLLKEKFNADICALSERPEYSSGLFENIKFLQRNDFKAITNKLKVVDLVVLGGGGLFQDYDKLEPRALFSHPEYGVQSYINLPLLAKIYKKPIAYLFQGVGPFFSSDAKKFAQYAFSLADYISVRDVASYNILSEMGKKDIVLSTDPVFLYSIKKEHKKSDNKKIGISLRRWHFGNFEERCIKSFADFLKDIAGEYEICFFSFQDLDEYNSDSYMYKQINAVLDDDSFKIIKAKDCPLEEIESNISSLDFMIGMRYHSIVLAAKYDVPFIGLSYWNKIDELVKDLSVEEYCLNIDEISAIKLSHTFEKVVDDANIIKGKIEAGRVKLKERLQAGIQSFESFCRKGEMI